MNILNIKKNWMYKANKSVLGIQLTVTLLGILGVIFSKFILTDGQRIIYELHDNLFVVLVCVTIAYPVMILGNLCPKLDSDDPYMKVVNLPYSIKELFKMEMKNNFFRMILFLFITCLINVVLSMEFLPINEKMLNVLIDILRAAPIVFIIFFQFVVMIVLRLVKCFSFIKAFSLLVLGNTVLIGVIALIGYFFRILYIEVNMFFIIEAVIFTGSLIAFIIAWRNIEKINN
ncbi:MAG: hypothetical protein ACRCYE_15020 [Sarcina sp.]